MIAKMAFNPAWKSILNGSDHNFNYGKLKEILKFKIRID